jgi:hypothetical protein
MHALPSAELLSVWDRGCTQPLPQRALLLLAAACPNVSPDALARLSIGRRDGYLLRLREQTFGSQLESRTNCPACNSLLEMSFAVSDVCQEAMQSPISILNPKAGGGEDHGEGHVLEKAGYRVHYRSPSTVDLVSVTGNGRGLEEVEASRDALLERCLLAVERDGEPLPHISVGELPSEIVTAVLEGMARVDPQADITLALDCPVCRHQWVAVFDILSFFWQEIDAWAIRFLDDMHTLTTAYCWREADVLALTPRRRQFYLDRVRG